jgi:DNA (cytosine-5)-methyltransferase 1
VIANHVCASLSELDLRIAHTIPPGGNWRNVPEGIPSQRLAQIRVSAAAGEGSRSTYYGRLHPDRPAYTINTYYNRPGNGCFLHYDQHRTLSHREAARFQSFPDSFVFYGPQRAVCQQIGNAVPPLLALQIASALGEPGVMVDVFAGAGGLSLGFEWAGWRPLVAVDSDRHAVETFNVNISAVAIVGDMQDALVQEHVLQTARYGRGAYRTALVGGPPCQGFSTGGKARSAHDIRNGLYRSYAALLAKLRPDVFVFENVLGLLSLEKGNFVRCVMQDLRAAGYDVSLWKLNAANFGVPQRRQRVVIVGVPAGATLPRPPTAWTSLTRLDDLVGGSVVPSARDAIGDLPPLAPGQDGSSLTYGSEPCSRYAALLRGELQPMDYLGESELDGPIRQSGFVRSLAEATV